MYAVLKSARKVITRSVLALPVLALVGCVTPGGNIGQSINTGRPVPVALLVPAGSGDAGHEVLAQSLENAARLAMADLDGVTIDLRVYATAGQAETAAAVAQEAVRDGAKIILGPVFASAANAAGVAVSSRNVNVLAFSNNPDIAGGNVFVLGNTFENTANRLTRYAVSQAQGQIMVIHGQDTAESVGRDAIIASANQTGASVVAVNSFELNQTALINAIPDMADRARESGAQSIFFTSGTDGAIPLLTQLLTENGIKTDEFQFVGLRRWDIPSTAISLPGVQNSWFAVPDPQMAAQFEARYQAAYGTPPHPIAGLAYDGIAAIGALVAEGQSDALTTVALTQPTGFVGVGGIFRLLPDGTNERALAIATIQENEVIVIDPAPRRFAGAGL